ncbi:MAG: type II secretion system protein [Clostridia bacterium]
MKLFSKRGFTIVEVVISAVVLGIVIVAIASTSIMTINLRRKTDVKQNCILVSNNIWEVFVSDNTLTSLISVYPFSVSDIAKKESTIYFDANWQNITNAAPEEVKYTVRVVRIVDVNQLKIDAITITITDFNNQVLFVLSSEAK